MSKEITISPLNRAFLFLSSLSFCFFWQTVYAETKEDKKRHTYEKLSVLGSKEALPTRPGSSYVLTKKQMEEFDYIDIHRVLRNVPGVNVMDEDGFGLRPNIGLRGGHPERSKKVVLMEDGVLISPAPYSAPAAYYFPQMGKINSIEVFKGVPSTFFGPNSMGGAINLLTANSPPGAKLAMWGGQYGFQKYDFKLGLEQWGEWSLDYNRISSSGFKTLPNKDNTGFQRDNVMLRWNRPFEYLQQNLLIKVNWAHEVSNETYTGLDDADFKQNPFQRYAATQNDLMKWDHRQYFLNYSMEPDDSLRLSVTGYHHNFQRSWNKLNGFAGTNPSNPSPGLRDVLNEPYLSSYNYYYKVLTGAADSGALDDDRDILDLGNNQRRFISEGVQAQLEYEIVGIETNHLFKLFYRQHQDRINRFHQSTFWKMQSGQLVSDTSRPQENSTLNIGESKASTLALSYENQWGPLLTQAVGRYEDINYHFENKLTSEALNNNEKVFAPGLGFFYQAFRSWGLLMGVNKSYSPQGPGQPTSIRPGQSTNYEAGLRHTGHPNFGMELIGFYSQYSNLLGLCTFASGCAVGQLGKANNGGASHILGVEFLLKHNFSLRQWKFPVLFNGTYTKAEFQNEFVTEFPEWNGNSGPGTVRVGDPVPYIPDWQSQLSIGVEKGRWSNYLSFHYMGSMADQAVYEGRRVIRPRMVVGLSASYQALKNLKLRLRIDNVTNEKYAVSRRPFGLRPGRPLLAMAGLQYDFL